MNMPSIDDLLAYLDASPSPFHAVASSAARLDAAGFVAVSDRDDWTDLPADGYVAREGGIVAWRTPAGASPTMPFRLVGAHTDSPGLRVKPNPDAGSVGWRQLNVEVYGGILNNSWLDRDLGIAGPDPPRRRLVTAGRRLAARRAGPSARRAPRSRRERRAPLDPQQHLQPVWGVGRPSPVSSRRGSPPRPGSTRTTARSSRGSCASTTSRGRRCSATTARCWRADGSTTCSRAGRRPMRMAATTPTDAIAVMVLNDHEEVGSSSTTGAGGPLLERILERHVLARGGSRDELLRALSASSCVSADNAHAVHPNYPERHDPDHLPMVNAGPAIKVNSNQRYATSSATAAAFARACDAAGVPHQVFVSRNNMPCGSTIGPITATRLGIDTVDVGVPQLSMHSARELAGVHDPMHLARALRRAPSVDRVAPGHPVHRRVEEALQLTVEPIGVVAVDRPRQALALGRHRGRDGRTDLEVHLARVHELGVLGHHALAAADADGHDRHACLDRDVDRPSNSGWTTGPCLRSPSGNSTSGSPDCSTSMARFSASRSADPRCTGNAPSAESTHPM
jgi:aspartyl aminopeptidase